MASKVPVTREDARKAGDEIQVDWKKVDLEEFRRGLMAEIERHKLVKPTDVATDALTSMGQIVRARLMICPDYYTRQARLETGFMGSRSAIFILQVVYLAILAILVLLVWAYPLCFRDLQPLTTDWMLLVAWFGALGAIMVSIWGLTEHRNDWDPRWKYWHWSRPIVGASLAFVTVLAMRAGLVAFGGTQSGPDTSHLLYYVLAFVVGYREESVRRLIKKIADTILLPGE